MTGEVMPDDKGNTGMGSVYWTYYPPQAISLRDWLAGLALQGILAYEGPRALDAPYSAREAYRRSDAMLAERGLK